LSPDLGERPVNYCDLLARHPALSAKCRECNAHFVGEGCRRGRQIPYRCHAGLTDVVVPVIVGGTPIGALITGRLRLEPTGEGDFQRLPKSPIPGAWKEADWRKAWDRLPRWDARRLESLLDQLRLGAARLAESRPAPRLSARPEIGLILAHVRARLGEPIYLDEVCRGLGLSRAHVSTLFRRETGGTFAAWVARMRLEAACTLLRESAMPVHRIASACGFPDAPHFNRCFKKYAGDSPGNWRRGATRDSSRACDFDRPGDEPASSGRPSR